MIGTISLAVALLVADAPQIPGWLAGGWCTDGPESDRTCEYWTPETGGMMLGGSIATKGGKVREFEQLRIAGVDGVPVYFASPGGKGPAAFRAVAGEVMSITFANPDHDYPQRIRYALDGDVLTAEISLADGGKPMRWRYLRVTR